MIKVLLAVFVGLLRARPAVAAGDAAPVTAEHAHLMDGRASRSSRSSPPAGCS